MIRIMHIFLTGLLAWNPLQSQDIGNLFARLDFACDSKLVVIVGFPIEPEDVQQVREKFNDLRSKALSFPEPACIYYLLPRSWQGISQEEIAKRLSGSLPLLCEKFKFINFNQDIIRQTWNKILVFNKETGNVTQFFPSDNYKIIVKQARVVNSFRLRIPTDVQLGRLIAVTDSMAVFLSLRENEFILVNLHSGGLIKKVPVYATFCEKVYPKFSESGDCQNEMICKNAVLNYGKDGYGKWCDWKGFEVDSMANALVLKGFCFYCKEVIRRNAFLIPQGYMKPIALKYKLPSLKFVNAIQIDSQSIASRTTETGSMIIKCLDTAKIVSVPVDPQYLPIKVFAYASNQNETFLLLEKLISNQDIQVSILSLNPLQLVNMQVLISGEKIYLKTNREILVIDF